MIDLLAGELGRPEVSEALRLDGVTAGQRQRVFN